MHEGRLYRSARPDDASDQDRRRLVEEYGIKSIIDLRTKYLISFPSQAVRTSSNRLRARSEHIKQAKKRDADMRSSAAIPQSNNATAEALKIPGIRYHEVNLNGGAFERALLWQLSWSSLSRLLGLMALGRRTEAISILGREVMQPRGLVGLGKDSIDHCWAELNAIFRIVADSSQYPIVVHCTQGKDRTGLVVMLLLLMLDIPFDAIAYDYVASEAELLSEKEARMQEIVEIGLTEEFAWTPPDFVMKVTQHINTQYGGLLSYFQRIGIGNKTQEKIDSILIL
ncbi:MAG: hypothetical protein M1830_003459 [Pleopsidium flavum]|nr:MAG: hypothetical protein M1830_003459 [Pleopsidium flavum]